MACSHWATFDLFYKSNFLFYFFTAPNHQRIAWSNQEESAVLRHLAKYVKTRKLPGKLECTMAKEKEPALKNRSWQHIKHFVRNKILREVRKTASFV